MFRIDGLKPHPDLERIILRWERALEQLRRRGFCVAKLDVRVPTEGSLLLPRLELAWLVWQSVGGTQFLKFKNDETSPGSFPSQKNVHCHKRSLEKLVCG